MAVMILIGISLVLKDVFKVGYRFIDKLFKN